MKVFVREKANPMVSTAPVVKGTPPSSYSKVNASSECATTAPPRDIRVAPSTARRQLSAHIGNRGNSMRIPDPERTAADKGARIRGRNLSARSSINGATRCDGEVAPPRKYRALERTAHDAHQTPRLPIAMALPVESELTQK